MWTRGVDTDLFRPERAIELGLARRIFLTMGRLAVEKNLEAFLALDLPGTKVVIGTGPQELALKGRLPDAQLLGVLGEQALAPPVAAPHGFAVSRPAATVVVVAPEAPACGVADAAVS